jgi:AcrR family transcriptional regulator
MVDFRNEAVLRVRDALASGALKPEDLSARRLAEFFGQTTSLVYHHWGSMDRLLYAVHIAALSLLADELEELACGPHALWRMAEHYLELALDRPALFHIISERAFDWAALREARLIDEDEGLRAWRALESVMAREGSRHPAEDTRLFVASIHGIATLTAAGRMNTADLGHSDREVAWRTARRLLSVVRRAICAGSKRKVLREA